MKARVLQAEDLSALAELRLEGIRRFPHAFLLTEAEARKSDSHLLGWVTSDNAFGLFDGKRLIGFAGLRGLHASMTQHRAHLGPFYVTPEHQGSGAADVLVSFLFDAARARGFTQVELFVASENTRARSFYGRNGFVSTGPVPNAVIQDGVPIDDLFMVRDLTRDLLEPGPDGMRRLTPGDWRAFRSIRLEMLEQAPTGFGSTHAEWAEKAPDQIMAWLEEIHLWAVVEGGSIRATTGWHPMGGAVTRHRGHVIAVYTTPDARGRGLAAQLLTAVADDARAHGAIQLELDVGAENTAARAAYSAAGYREVGSIPRALNHGGHIHDQLYMVLPLDTA